MLRRTWACLLAAAAAALALSCARRDLAAPRQPPRNLLLITLDTFRADRVGAYGGTGGLTPHLDALAARGTRFDAAWSTVPLTLPSHTTIMTGLLPVAHGMRQNGSGRLPDDVATLASVLAGAGFRTGAFVSAFVLNHRFGLDRGFATYDDEIPQAPGRLAGIEAQRPGRDVVDRALSWLAADQGRPFFLWVHLFDAHAPYDPPEPYRSRFAAAPYDGEIAETDEQVGRLLAALRESGAEATTLIVVAGDHGEALGEHGEPTHGMLLFEPTLRVPLIVVAPGELASGGVVRTPVSLVDLAPTATSLLGIDWPGRTGERAGRNLSADLLAGREPAPAPLYAETEYPLLFGWSDLAAIRRGALKFVAAPSPLLFDLAADPGEDRNLVDDRRREAVELRRELAALRADAVDHSTAAPDEEARRQLAALGYVGGSSDATRQTGSERDPNRLIGLFVRLENAREALAGGHAERAAAELTRLVAEDPRNPVFRGTRALALRQLGEGGLAVEELKKTLGFGPGDLQTLFDLVTALHENGQRDEAERVARELLRRDPGFAEGHNTLGVLRLEAGATEEARREFERAVDLDSGNANAANNLGNALRAQGRFDEAERAYRRAAELVPDWADPWNGLGTLEVQRGRPAAALPLFDRALELDPRRFEAMLNRAIALDTLGRREEAATAYRTFLRAAAADPAFASQRRAAEALLARLKSR